MLSICFLVCGHHRDLHVLTHSFPTRRSSDLFAMTALMAMAASHAAYGSALTVRAAEWFIAFSMVVLSLLKLQNVGSFATMFLNYDLLARRWPPYSYIYPFAEGLAGVLMVAGALNWISVPVALFIGTVGADRKSQRLKS